MQVCLTELLKQELDLKPDFLIGHSAGETALGYADECLTIEQTLSIAYYRGKFGNASAQQEKRGAMYACGVDRPTAENLFKKHGCGERCGVACINDGSMMTLSGCEESMAPILNELKGMKQPTNPEKPVFLRRLETFGVAYHSPMLEPFLESLRKDLKEVIPEPKLRSQKWVSSCFTTGGGEYLSADYHCHNFRAPVEFVHAVEGVLDRISCADTETDVVFLEVGPHALFKGSVKKDLYRVASSEK